MPSKAQFAIPEEHVGKRLDKWLSEQDGFTRTLAQRLCADSLVLAGHKPVGKNYRLCVGDMLTVMVPEPKELDVVPQDIPLDIVYEDTDLLVINKPKGMVVHPAAGNDDGTLVNALLFHCKGGLSGINGVVRPGIVHRIDKNTSGLLIVAKNDNAHTSLAAQIKAHTFTRVYEAVVYGAVKQDGTVDAPIGRHSVERKKMCVTEKNSRNAVTHYEVIVGYQGFTHIRCRLETGRTHQIRVHMAYIGHPVCGDEVYGPRKSMQALGGQCLHARAIGFIHPSTEQYMEFSSALPRYFTDFLRTIGGDCNRTNI